MWIARDKKGNPVTKNDNLQLFLVKPTRCEEGYWHTDDWEYPESQDMYLPISWVKNFDYLTWNDDPLEVEIVPKGTKIDYLGIGANLSFAEELWEERKKEN